MPEEDLWNEGHTPIVLALDGRYDFTDVEGGVHFDIDANGTPNAVAWPRTGNVAFLFDDRNGNGLPDHGGELFGNDTMLSTGVKARHGFEALAEYDTNADGSVTATDASWTQLRLWRDFDHNGMAHAGEISTLDDLGVTALGLQTVRIGKRDRHGNLLRWRSHIALSNGRTLPYYDVILLTQPSP